MRTTKAKQMVARQSASWRTDDLRRIDQRGYRQQPRTTPTLAQHPHWIGWRRLSPPPSLLPEGLLYPPSTVVSARSAPY